MTCRVDWLTSRVLGAALLLLLAGFPACSQPRDIERDGITVRHLMTEFADGVVRPSWQASVAVDVPPATVWRIITDQNHFAEFMPLLVGCSVMEDAPGTRLVAFHAKLLWVSVRYFMRLTLDPKELTIDFHLEKELPHDIEDSHGKWELQPMGARRTRITYTVHVDTGRPVPDFLAQRLYRRNTLALMQAMRKRALTQ